MQTISTGAKSEEDMIEEFKVNTDFRTPNKMNTNTWQSQQKGINADWTTEPVIVDLFQTDINWIPKYWEMTAEWSVDILKEFLWNPPKLEAIQRTWEEQLLWGLMLTDTHFDLRDVDNNTIKKRMEITTGRIFKVLDRMMKHDPDEIMIANLGDTFNSDGQYKTSSQKPSMQNNISEKDAFRKVLDWTIGLIDRVRETGKPVSYIGVPWNHDNLTSEHAGVALEYYFGDSVPITTAQDRAYKERGNTLIAMGHGDHENPSNMLQFAVGEHIAKRSWTNPLTKLYWYLGNQHRQIIGQNWPMMIKNLLAPNPKSWRTQERWYDMVQGQHWFVRDKEEWEIAEVRW